MQHISSFYIHLLNFYFEIHPRDNSLATDAPKDYRDIAGNRVQCAEEKYATLPVHLQVQKHNVWKDKPVQLST